MSDHTIRPALLSARGEGWDAALNELIEELEAELKSSATYNYWTNYRPGLEKALRMAQKMRKT